MKTPSDNLRNFVLTVDEIKLERAIQDLQKAISSIRASSPGSNRLAFFESQIAQLEEQLDELREHTLIELN